MKLTYFGHSAFQIETNGTTLLVDPFITGNGHTEGVVTADELEPDYILLTHAHGDHWGDTADIAGRTGAQVVGIYEIAQYLGREHDYDNVQPMNIGGWWDFDWGRAFMTYARHSSSFPDGTYGGFPAGYILHIEDRCIYITGDTCPFAEMEWYGLDHAIDVCLMPIGDCFTMGPTEAVRAAKMLNPKLTIPLHYNTFPLIEVDPNSWVDQMKAAGFEARVLAPGETMPVD